MYRETHNVETTDEMNKAQVESRPSQTRDSFCLREV